MFASALDHRQWKINSFHICHKLSPERGVSSRRNIDFDLYLQVNLVIRSSHLAVSVHQLWLTHTCLQYKYRTFILYFAQQILQLGRNLVLVKMITIIAGYGIFTSKGQIIYNKYLLLNSAEIIGWFIFYRFFLLKPPLGKYALSKIYCAKIM